MKRLCLIIGVVGSLSAATLSLLAEPALFDPPQYPKRLKRADSFLGVHFDFHAGPECNEIGKNTPRAMVEAIIDQVKPDYLQTDCKGHPGLSSYPTKVGNPAPGFVGDPLKIWRQVTAERGVALYMHYSGVWDGVAVKEHPDWARVNSEGRTDDHLTSTFGPYVDKLLIPQFKELSDVYGVDGVWVDGECWAVARDYCDAAIKLFLDQTGAHEIPRKSADPRWFEWNQFHREAFRRYVRHYVDEMHRHNPDFQLASNWAFSDHMPEPVGIDVDYLSGDYSPTDSVNSARFSARCLASQSRPWDLMAWSFGKSDDANPQKTVPQLQREASVVLAQGGGFQAYFTQKRDGSIRDWQMKLMAETAKFCRERQAICHHAVSVPQVALLYSTEAHYRECQELFQPSGAGVVALKGVLHALLDSQYSVDIRSEHHLRGRMEDYPMIVVPEWNNLDAAFKNELRDYVKDGGKLMLIGPEATGLFEPELSIDSTVASAAEAKVWLEHVGAFAPVKTLVQKISLRPSARAFGQLRAKDDFTSSATPAASIADLGKGKIAAVWFNFGTAYMQGQTATAREFLAALTHELIPQPMVELTGSHRVEVALARNHGKLLVNLVNTSGPHADKNVLTLDEVTPLGPLEIIVRVETKPRDIHVEPGNQKIKWTFANGECRFALAGLDIHDVVVVE